MVDSTFLDYFKYYGASKTQLLTKSLSENNTQFVHNYTVSREQFRVLFVHCQVSSTESGVLGAVDCSLLFDRYGYLLFQVRNGILKVA